MTRAFRLVACAAVALALPAAVHAATGPDDDGDARPPCAASIQQPRQDAKEPWRERFSDWLRRRALRESGEGGSYYFRSPLLTAFGLRAQTDCGANEEAEIAVASAAHRCVAIVIDTRADARMIMELPLPQLGALNPAAFVVAVKESLARGESVRIHDHDGNPLILDPAITKRVQTDTCG